MKNLIFRSLGITLLLLCSSAIAQSKWQEDTHYEVINDTASAKKQVKEVFSFWCPHCFTFEPIALQLKAELPGDVQFKKAHVNFMGTASREAQDEATKAMLAAKAIKQEDLFNDALFKAIHRERKTITGMEDILAIFSAAGGDSAKLEKLSNSFGIRSQLGKNDAMTKGISRVPAFIVNDKYKAIFTRDMTPDQFVELIIWLTTQK